MNNFSESFLSLISSIRSTCLEHLDLCFLKFADIKLIRHGGWNIDARNNTVNIIYKETDYKTIVSEETNEVNCNLAIKYEIHLLIDLVLNAPGIEIFTIIPA